MNETKTKHIRIEEHKDGDRLAQTDNDGKQMLAMIVSMNKRAKYAENGRLKLASENAAKFIETVAILYGFLEPETVSEDADPDDVLHADAADAVADQTVVEGGGR